MAQRPEGTPNDNTNRPMTGVNPEAMEKYRAEVAGLSRPELKKRKDEKFKVYKQAWEQATEGGSRENYDPDKIECIDGDTKEAKHGKMQDLNGELMVLRQEIAGIDAMEENAQEERNEPGDPVRHEGTPRAEAPRDLATRLLGAPGSKREREFLEGAKGIIGKHENATYSMNLPNEYMTVATQGGDSTVPPPVVRSPGYSPVPRANNIIVSTLETRPLAGETVGYTFMKAADTVDLSVTRLELADVKAINPSADEVTVRTRLMGLKTKASELQLANPSFTRDLINDDLNYSMEAGRDVQALRGTGTEAQINTANVTNVTGILNYAGAQQVTLSRTGTGSSSTPNKVIEDFASGLEDLEVANGGEMEYAFLHPNVFWAGIKQASANFGFYFPAAQGGQAMPTPVFWGVPILRSNAFANTGTSATTKLGLGGTFSGNVFWVEKMGMTLRVGFDDAGDFSKRLPTIVLDTWGTIVVRRAERLVHFNMSRAT